MLRTRIKICGVRDTATALTAAGAGADAVGLVFVEQSPRHVSVDTASAIVAALPALVEPVGLFADAPLVHVQNTALRVGLRTLQLHGREEPFYLQRLASFRIIKALPFDPATIEFDLQPYREVGPPLAAILLDTPPKPEAVIPGGSGVRFDWDALGRLTAEGLFDDLPPIILAGGLTPDNVAEAVRKAQPYAVDVSSGVESERGIKDPAKITTFCRAVRHADSRKP